MSAKRSIRSGVLSSVAAMSLRCPGSRDVTRRSGPAGADAGGDRALVPVGAVAVASAAGVASGRRGRVASVWRAAHLHRLRAAPRRAYGRRVISVVAVARGRPAGGPVSRGRAGSLLAGDRAGIADRAGRHPAAESLRAEPADALGGRGAGGAVRLHVRAGVSEAVEARGAVADAGAGGQAGVVATNVRRAVDRGLLAGPGAVASADRRRRRSGARRRAAGVPI